MISRFQFNSIAACAALLVFSTTSPSCLAQSASTARQGSGTTQQQGSGTTQQQGSGTTQQQGSGTTQQQGSGTTQQQGSGSATKGAAHPALTNPALANKTAPEKFLTRFSTTKGDFVVEVTRSLSPNGADRFYNMVDIGYFQNIAIFRAIPNFMMQFGVHGDPNISRHWKDATIKDDAPGQVSNLPGFLTFAKTGRPNSRSAQIFINLGSNGFLDRQGFTPFGKVVQGMEVVSRINTEYGENDPSDQGTFVQKGNEWLLKKYPRLDIIKSVKFVEGR